LIHAELRLFAAHRSASDGRNEFESRTARVRGARRECAQRKAHMRLHQRTRPAQHDKLDTSSTSGSFK
jgi:hypothetical protein